MLLLNIIHWVWNLLIAVCWRWVVSVLAKVAQLHFKVKLHPAPVAASMKSQRLSLCSRSCQKVLRTIYKKVSCPSSGWMMTVFEWKNRCRLNLPSFPTNTADRVDDFKFRWFSKKGEKHINSRVYLPQSAAQRIKKMVKKAWHKIRNA